MTKMYIIQHMLKTDQFFHLTILVNATVEQNKIQNFIQHKLRGTFFLFINEAFTSFRFVKYQP